MCVADVDIPVKRIMQIRPEDYVEFIVPGCRREWIRELSPQKVPKRESRMDKLLFINSPEEEFILNIEPQAYYDKTMAARMLRYRSDIWEYTLQENMGTPSIKQAVIYFFKKDDNKKYSLEDKWDEEVTSILGEYALASGIITKYIRREMLMNSPLFNEWVEEERKEAATKAAEKAKKESARKYIIDLLTEKFDFVPKAIRESIENLDDISVLDELHKKIIKIATIEEFKILLDKAKNI